MALVEIVVFVLALLASAYANCSPTGGSGTIQAGQTATIGPMCASLTSSCIHPGGSTYSCTTADHSTCCTGGGSDPDLVSTAPNNLITCSIVVVPNPTLDPTGNASCVGSWGLNTENSVYFMYTPCQGFIGTATLVCSSMTQGNDWSNGQPPALVGSATYTIHVTAVTCPNPCYGTCSPTDGCVCPAGLSGPNCDFVGSGNSTLNPPTPSPTSTPTPVTTTPTTTPPAPTTLVPTSSNAPTNTPTSPTSTSPSTGLTNTTTTPSSSAVSISSFNAGVIAGKIIGGLVGLALLV